MSDPGGKRSPQSEPPDGDRSTLKEQAIDDAESRFSFALPLLLRFIFRDVGVAKGAMQKRDGHRIPAPSLQSLDCSS